MTTLFNKLAVAVLFTGALSIPTQGLAAETRTVTTVTTTRTPVTHHYVHRRHPVRKTIKRVGIGAAGGAVAGALIGGGPGAAIGAVAGGGAGAIYDQHEKSKGK